MARTIPEHLAQTTVRIDNPHGQRGSGFFVGRLLREESPGVKHWKVYAVTNKHVIHKERAIRHATTHVTLNVNAKIPDGALVAEAIRFDLTDADGRALWREHPDDEVDVYAFDVTGLLASRRDLDVQIIQGASEIADANMRASHRVTAGEDVIVAGYPLGMRQGPTNHPLLRQGIIATRIGERLREDVPAPGGGVRVRELRGFLIDGATVPGSSGSPVFLKPLSGNVIVVEHRPAVMLLGIVAETRFAPISTPTGSIPSYAGLGLAFDAETIVETIALF